jgi:hypothetical protein
MDGFSIKAGETADKTLAQHDFAGSTVQLGRKGKGEIDMTLTQLNILCNIAFGGIFAAALASRGAEGTVMTYVTYYSTTAVQVAEAVLTPISGKRAVRQARPFIAVLTNGFWNVAGGKTPDSGVPVPHLEISMSTGRVTVLPSGAQTQGTGIALGLVPDARTAVLIAEAVLNPIYGEPQIRHERPFIASLRNGVWGVEGTLHEGLLGFLGLEPTLGGVAFVQISKTNAQILRITHGK